MTLHGDPPGHTLAAVQTLDSPAPDLGDRLRLQPHLTLLRRDDHDLQLGFDAADAVVIADPDGSLHTLLELMDGRYRLGELHDVAARLGVPVDRAERSSPLSPPPGCCRGHRSRGRRRSPSGSSAWDRPVRGSASSSSGRSRPPRRRRPRQRVTVVGLGPRTGSGAAGRPLVRPVDRPGGSDDRAGDEPRDRSRRHHGTDPGRSPAPARTTAGPGRGGGPTRPPGPDQLPGVRRSGPDASRSGLAADAGPALPHPRRLGPLGRRLGGRPGDDAGPVPSGRAYGGDRIGHRGARACMRGPGSDASGPSIRPADVVGPRAQNGDRSARTPRAKQQTSGVPHQMSDTDDPLARSSLRRGARLASLPLGFAGRATLGLGKRIGGSSAERVNAELQERAAQQLFKVLGELKGGAMKFGQTLSLFEAVLPEDMAEAVPRAPDPTAGLRSPDAHVAGPRRAGPRAGRSLEAGPGRARSAAGGRGLHRSGAPRGLARRPVGRGEGAVSGRRRGAALRPAADRPAVEGDRPARRRDGRQAVGRGDDRADRRGARLHPGGRPPAAGGRWLRRPPGVRGAGGARLDVAR